MRKVGDLFKELGFNENGSDDVKIAFIKNLVKAAYGTDVKPPDLIAELGKVQKKPTKEEQLSFDLAILDDVKKAN